MSSDESTKDVIFATLTDLVSDFMFYDRKGDEDLGVGRIERAVKDGAVTVNDLVEHFTTELRKYF